MVHLLSQAQVTLAFLLCAAQADWLYRSRPDLSPPRLNITIPAGSDVGPGYIFVAPYRGFIQSEGLDGPEQPGAYIFRDSGDLVWSSIGILDGWVGNFQVTRWNGSEVLQAFQGTLDSFHGHGYGHPTILDSHYESVREVRPANARIISIHEFRIVNEKSALIEVYQPTAMDLSACGGAADQQWIVDGIIQEFDIETEKMIFEWRSLDHVDPRYSAISLTSGAAFSGVNSSVAWDYFHTNSVDKDDQGNYLVSARHMSTVYKINGTTGEIIWRLGGKQSDFDMPPDAEFAYQHDARFRYRSTDGNSEIISLFDNAARSNGHRGGGMDSIRDYSTAKVLKLDLTNMRATVLHSLSSPDKLLAPSQGNVQFLPNGNIFVNWGQAGVVTEYRASDSEPIFNARIDSDPIGFGVQSYRGFRFEWKGYPNESPALAALQNTDGSHSVTAYVSWNGDTETAAWRFYAVQAPSKGVPANRRSQRLLGDSKRVSFETSFTFSLDDFTPKESVMVFAEAIDHNGKILSCTDTTEIYTDVQRVASSGKKPGYGINKSLMNQLPLGEL